MKNYCVLIDNGYDGLEMQGFYESLQEARESIDQNNYQIWEIQSGELIEERWT